VDGPEFTAQLTRFLPAATVARTIGRPAFRESLADTVLGLYEQAGWRLGG